MKLHKTEFILDDFKFASSKRDYISGDDQRARNDAYSRQSHHP